MPLARVMMLKTDGGNQLMKLLQEVYKLTSNRRRIYFLWKNGLSNNKTDYSKWSKEDIINKFFNGSEEAFKRMELWERTDEYARLMYLLTKERMNSDFFDIYDSIVDKAKAGDERSIKTFLMLQKEVKSNLKELNRKPQEIEEDDGLILD